MRRTPDFTAVHRVLCTLSLPQESLVVAHEKLSFELPHGIESHAHHDEQTRAAQGKRTDVGDDLKEIRQYRNSREEQRPPPR